MDNKMQELLMKMRELGMTEEDLLKSLQNSAQKTEEKEIDINTLHEVHKQVRNIIKNITNAIYIDGLDKLNKEILPLDIMTATQFKDTYKEFASAELVRLVRLANNMISKLGVLEGNIALREEFMNIIGASDDVVYGYITLFGACDRTTLYEFAKRAGSARGSYSIVESACLNNDGLVKVNTIEELENAKKEMLKHMNIVLSTQIENSFSKEFIDEFVRLSPLSSKVFDRIETEEDMLIAYGTAISILIIAGLTRPRTVLKMALEDVREDIVYSNDSKNLVNVIGDVYIK
ncbi:MAG: hypothetical protein ACRC41_11625 [Sarcina sp.]